MPRGRLTVLLTLAVVASVAALMYVRSLERRADEPLVAPPRAMLTPTGPPPVVALRCLYYCAWQGSRETHAAETVRKLIKRAQWGRALPPRATFDDAVAEAARLCGEDTSPAEWLHRVEYYGNLPTKRLADDVTLERLPFIAGSVFGEGATQAWTGSFLFAVGPTGCGNGDALWVMNYAGGVVQSMADDPELQVFRTRTRILSEHARAFRDPDVDTLAPFAAHADPIVRRETVQALIRSGASEAIPHIRPRLDDAVHEIRYIALFGLAALGDRTVEPYLRRLLGDDTEYFGFGIAHYRAALALGRLGFSDVRAELEMMADWHSPALFPAEAREVLHTLPAERSTGTNS